MEIGDVVAIQVFSFTMGVRDDDVRYGLLIGKRDGKFIALSDGEVLMQIARHPDSNFANEHTRNILIAMDQAFTTHAKTFAKLAQNGD